MTLEDVRSWIVAFSGRQGRASLTSLRDPLMLGVNPTVAALREGIWYSGGPILYPSTAGEQVEVISSTANDAAAGTGLRTIRLDYLTPDGFEVSVDATMNGLAAVAFPTLDVAWVRRAYGLTFGALGHADGNITIRTVAAATAVESILAGVRQSASARYRVPAGRDLLVWGIEGKASPSTAAVLWLEHDFDRLDSAGDPVFLANTRPVWQLQIGDRPRPLEPIPPLWLPAETRLECSAIRVGASNALVSCIVKAVEVLR